MSAHVNAHEPRPSGDRTLVLWRSYKASGDSRTRDRLVLTFAPIVKYIVYRRIREIPARCDIEEFLSCGLVALIRALDDYDPQNGSTLEQYAWTRIHGAVLAELHQKHRPAGAAHGWQREISRAAQQFASLYGRRPTSGELSDALGITVDTPTAHEDRSVHPAGQLESLSVDEQPLEDVA